MSGPARQSAASRREFLKSAGAAIGTAAAWGLAPGLSAAGYRSPNERPVVAYIGCGIRYEGLVREHASFATPAMICDVDGAQLRRGLQTIDNLYTEHKIAPPLVDTAEDYRRVLDRSDIDAVVISTPDHWHTKIAIEALQAGKDVYCEKPLTHHVAEGRKILQALEASGRVMQVGTQQRSGKQFQTAVALARSGRAGAVQRVTCIIDGAPACEALPTAAPPAEMNWNRWLGPAPWAAYREAGDLPTEGYAAHLPFGRGHGHFRWWYEYAGGKLTDWGAHHVDIAMWALNKSTPAIGPYSVDPVVAVHPVEFRDGNPVVDDRINTATDFEVRVQFADGMKLDIVDYSDRLKSGNGVMFECEKGRYFVNRGKLTGKPVQELKDNPLPAEALSSLYAGQGGGSTQDDWQSHAKNFYDCVKSRDQPLSDVASHHTHLSVCHVANIALRLGRKLKFDPAAERFENDPQADALLSRDYRKGFEIEG